MACALVVLVALTVVTHPSRGLSSSLALQGLAQTIEGTASTWTYLRSSDGLLGDVVHALLPLPDGGMLVGTSGGLSIWRAGRFATASAGNGLPEGYVSALAVEGEHLWVGTWGGGLALHEGARWLRLGDDDSPTGDWVTSLAVDDGGLWVATYGAGLWRHTSAGWTTYRRSPEGLPSDYLTAIVPDGRGGAWVGTEREGLAHLGVAPGPAEPGAWTRLPLPEGLGPEVTALAVAGDTLYVGATRGAARLSPEDPAELVTLDGTPDSRVTALVTDAAGSILYIGTGRGVSIWQEGEVIETVGVAEGLAHAAVSALALDAEGRLWVGSLARGLAVRGELTMQSVERLPVVLVHGWRGPDSDTLEDSEFRHMARWLRDDGFLPYYATGISHENTLYENATRLREVIAEAKALSGAAEVWLVGFSMGGLNSRAYVESALYADDVRRVFTLGSPHRGEHLWFDLMLWEYLAWTDEPSVLELTPVHMALYNRLHRHAAGPPYTLVASDARQDDLPTLFRELPPGDGLVSAWSALAPEEIAGERVITDDIHAWSRDSVLLHLPSLLLPRTTYDAHIRPYLFGATETSGSAFQVAPYEPPLLPPRTAYRWGEVQAGGEGSATLPIQETERARVDVRWRGPRPTVRLRTPDGEVLEGDPDSALASDDRYEYLDLGFADYVSYLLTDPMPGEWTVLVEGTAGAATSTEWVAYARVDTQPRLRLETQEDWLVSGETVEVSIHLEGASTTLAETDVEILVYSPERLPRTATPVPGELTSSGEGDYLWRWAAPNASGYHVVLVTVRGAGWERQQAIIIGVRGDVAELAGTYSLDTTEEEGGAALHRVTVPIVVHEERPLLLAVMLEDDRGRPVGAASVPLHLGVGPHQVEVPVPEASSTRPGASGSPHVRRVGHVALLDITGVGVLLDEMVAGAGGMTLARLANGQDGRDE